MRPVMDYALPLDALSSKISESNTAFPEDTSQKMIEAGTWNAHLIKRSQIQKQLYATGRKISSFTTNNPLKTPEGKAKHKQALAKIGHSQCEKNSQFGTRWITNNVENKKITRDSIVPDGWRLGRVKVNK